MTLLGWVPAHGDDWSPWAEESQGMRVESLGLAALPSASGSCRAPDFIGCVCGMFVDGWRFVFNSGMLLSCAKPLRCLQSCLPNTPLGIARASSQKGFLQCGLCLLTAAPRQHGKPQISWEQSSQSQAGKNGSLGARLF